MNGNSFSRLNTYERRHLPTHLAEVRRFHELHTLFVIESAGGGNAWYEIKQESNESADYLSDLALAWSVAEQNQDYGLECRYALASATWNTLASNLHPAMYPALVESGVWTSERAFAAALRTSLFRPQALALVTPYLEASDRDRAFDQVREDLRELGTSLPMTLEKIAHVLPKPLVREILSWPPVMLKGDGAAVRSSEALLLPRLAELGDADEARAWAERLRDSLERFRALCGIAPFLARNEGLPLLERLAVQFRPSGYMPDNEYLLALAQGFAALGCPDRAIESSRRAEWPPARDRALEIVATVLARAGRVAEALESTKGIENSHRAAVALARVSDQLHGAGRREQLETALELAREKWRGHVESLRIDALAEVGSRLPDSEPVLGEALDAALVLGRFSRGSSIASIAHLLTPELLRKALSELQAIGDRAHACRVLAELAIVSEGDASHFIVRTALECIAKIDHPRKRWAALLQMLPVRGIQSQLLPLLTSVSAELSAEDWASAETLAFPDPLDDEIAEVVLAAAAKTSAARAPLVTALAPCVSDGLFQRLSNLAFQIEDPKGRADVLVAIAPRTSEERIPDLMKACDRSTPDTFDHVAEAVAKRLTASGRYGDAMALSRRLRDREQRLRVFANIAKYAPETQPALAESVIEHLRALTWRPPAFSVSSIAGALRPELAASVLDAAHSWALRVGQNNRDLIIQDIVGPLTRAGLTSEARNAAQDIADPANQLTALATIANAAHEPVRTAILKAACELANSMPDGLEEMRALGKLLPLLPEPERDRIAARIDLKALAAELPAWVAEIVPQLLPTRVEELLKLDDDEITAAVVQHTRGMSRDEVQPLWQSLSHLAGRRRRTGALESLRITVPWVKRLGEGAALQDACRAVTDVTRWWP